MPVLSVVLFFVAVAFVPSLLYVAWARHAETHHREPVPALLRVFLAGAVLAVVLALFLGALVEAGVRPLVDAAAIVPYLAFAAVVVAPVTEEFAKVLSVWAARDDHPEPEDGFVYGAAAGLGFAATENLLYEGVALATGGVGAWIGTATLRTLSSTLLHASASAWAGYGVMKWRSGAGSFAGAIGFLALAMAMHAAFNLLASTGLALAALLAVVLAFSAFRHVRHRIRRHDAVPTG